MYVVGSTVRKDQIFYEGHKKLKKSPTLLTQLSNFKKRWETSFSNFVAFSQYLNFKLDSGARSAYSRGSTRLKLKVMFGLGPVLLFCPKQVVTLIKICWTTLNDFGQC